MGSLALVTGLLAWESGDDCRRTYLLDTQACTAQYQLNLLTDTPLADGTLRACLQGAKRDYAQCAYSTGETITSDT